MTALPPPSDYDALEIRKAAAALVALRARSVLPADDDLDAAACCIAVDTLRGKRPPLRYHLPW